ncbi:hypothetical protein [Companilactobacillus kimchiensis]|nr:hypothetical protein [Companilactobacillus kimchiensis]
MDALTFSFTVSLESLVTTGVSMAEVLAAVSLRAALAVSVLSELVGAGI